MPTSSAAFRPSRHRDEIRDAHGRLLDDDGNVIEGIVRDGHSVRIPMMMADGKPVTGGASVARMSMTDGASLTDAASQHAFVREKLGAEATGKSAAFLDAAYRALTASASAVAAAPARPVLSDAERAYSQRGIEAAVAYMDRRQPMADARATARADYKANLASAWAMNDSQRAMASNEALRHAGAQRPLPAAPVVDATRLAQQRRGMLDGYTAAAHTAKFGDA